MALCVRVSIVQKKDLSSNPSTHKKMGYTSNPGARGQSQEGLWDILAASLALDSVKDPFLTEMRQTSDRGHSMSPLASIHSEARATHTYMCT